LPTSGGLHPMLEQATRSWPLWSTPIRTRQGPHVESVFYQCRERKGPSRVRAASGELCLLKKARLARCTFALLLVFITHSGLQNYALRKIWHCRHPKFWSALLRPAKHTRITSLGRVNRLLSWAGIWWLRLRYRANFCNEVSGLKSVTKDNCSTIEPC
jgi:hypothetical protein